MEKFLYSIGEVAEILGENTSLVRFWSNSFPKFFKPHRNAKGDRSYTRKEVETFRQIHYLVKVEGYTLEGAAKQLKENTKGAFRKAKALESLKAIRRQLVEIRKSL